MRHPGPHSSTERFLKGKITKLSDSPVTEVLKNGTKRVLIFEDGSRKVMTDRKLVEVLRGTMAEMQRAAMERTIRPTGKKHQVEFRIGGAVNGETVKRANRARATRTIAQHYSEAPGVQRISVNDARQKAESHFRQVLNNIRSR